VIGEWSLKDLFGHLAFWDDHATEEIERALAGLPREDNAWRYLLNTLRNVEHIVTGPDPGRLRGQFAGVPAIVIGAGPSLDRTMEALRAVGGRALLLAESLAGVFAGTAGAG